MHFTLHLTAACNMACSYCYAPPRACPGMALETGKKALDFAARTTKESCGIVFFGGEPLLHKKLIRDLVAYGREMERYRAGRFHFKLTTNGLLLDEEFLDFSIHNDVLIAMSFDGVREAHDRHRRFSDGRPTFDILYPKLKMLLASRPYSSVMMVVNPETAQHLVESTSFLIAEGCRYVIVSLNYAAEWEEKHFRVLGKQLERLADLYVKWTEEERKFYLSPFEVKLSSHINRHCFRKERCELAQKQISVDSEGYLYPCVQFTKAGPRSEWCIGNIDTGIDQAARERIYALSVREKETCRECAIKERCNNSCGCLNWQTTGTLNEISPALCRYEQLLVPLADRIGEKLYNKRNPLFLHKQYNAAYPVLSLLEDAMKED